MIFDRDFRKLNVRCLIRYDGLVTSVVGEYMLVIIDNNDRRRIITVITGHVKVEIAFLA